RVRVASRQPGPFNLRLSKHALPRSPRAARCRGVGCHLRDHRVVLLHPISIPLQAAGARQIRPHHDADHAALLRHDDHRVHCCPGDVLRSRGAGTRQYGSRGGLGVCHGQSVRHCAACARRWPPHYQRAQRERRLEGRGKLRVPRRLRLRVWDQGLSPSCRRRDTRYGRRPRRTHGVGVKDVWGYSPV
ncbi:hypothetical protein T484DRAFT_1882638, partial [Baffinella frigidus]